MLKLDNVAVGQTSWKACSQQAWDQRFSIDLDKSRELEVGAAACGEVARWEMGVKRGRGYREWG